MGSARRNNRKRQPTGRNYAKSLVLKKKIKGLAREIRGIDAKIANCEIVEYQGVEATFQPFWTGAPAAHTRPREAQKTA